MATTMNADLQQLFAFHLTGERPSDASSDAGDSALRPALLSRYVDLARLRYDYPLVLVDRDPSSPVTSLSAADNRALQAIAPKGIRSSTWFSCSGARRELEHNLHKSNRPHPGAAV